MRVAANGPYDVAVIGGGVVGCAVVRAFALAGARAVLLERHRDLLAGASKGNSAILHTGFDALPGSLEERCVRRGYALYREVRDRLGLPLIETGAFVIAWSDEEAGRLPAVAAKAAANGVAVEMVDAAALRARSPHLGAGARAALWVPGEAVIDPWSAPLAYARQAIANGAEILCEAGVTGGTFGGGTWRLATARGAIEAALVVNCAGLHGDLVEAIARPSPFRIRPRKGQFIVFDKSAAALTRAILLPVPTARTKGIAVTPTAFGNLLLGPTAEEQESRDDATVSEDALRRLLAAGRRILPGLAGHAITATYAGIRPATDGPDYVIEALTDRAWITVAGIRSTGLTAALGIAEHVVGLSRNWLSTPRPPAEPAWPSVPNLAEGRPRPWQAPGRSEILCHCELVTRDEIEAALRGPLPARDLGGLKRRTRAMMGRCQGFYCSAAVAALCAGRLADMPGRRP